MGIGDWAYQQKLDTKYKKFDIKDEPLNKAI